MYNQKETDRKVEDHDRCQEGRKTSKWFIIKKTRLRNKEKTVKKGRGKKDATGKRAQDREV